MNYSKKRKTIFLILIIIMVLFFTLLVSACVITEKFKIVFMVDGKIYATINTNYNETISLPNNPTKNGYMFDGWYDTPEFTGNSITEIPLDEKIDKIFYGKWCVKDYPITYNLNGGTLKTSKNTYNIESSTVLDNPTRIGYTFDGWYNNSEFTGEQTTEIPVGEYGNKTFYAKWIEGTEGLIYTLESTGTYSVVGYRGNDSEIVIPASLHGISVTRISDSVFYNCYNLTNITIPDSVTSIGNSAFSGCTNLINITIPNSVISISYNAFNNCKYLTIYCEAKSKPSGWNSGWNNSNFPVVWNCNNNKVATDGSIYTIINGIKYCLKDKTAIITRQLNTTKRNITIPQNVEYKGTTYDVTRISDYAFYNCYNITNISIPNSVTSIGNSAFYNCYSLTNISIPDSVTSIEENTFRACGLTNITIPNSVTSIGASAFFSCNNLYTIIIPNSVISIGLSAFFGCSKLTSIVLPNNITRINGTTFEGCSNLTSITIPYSVTSIGNSAFSGCSKLTKINFNGTITEWKAVKKGDYWNEKAGRYEVFCTDGTL